MAYVISVMLFSAIFVIAAAMTGTGSAMINISSILIVAPTSIILGIGATSLNSATMALQLSISENLEVTPKLAKSARRFLHDTGNQCVLTDLAATLLGNIGLLVATQQIVGPLQSGYLVFAVSLLTLLYGLILKCLFYSAEHKLRDRYL